MAFLAFFSPRRLSGIVVLLCLVCIGLDIYRVTQAYTRVVYLVALIAADGWGILPYGYFALYKDGNSSPKVHTRFFQILLRLIFVVGALIAPSIDLHDTILVNQYYNKIVEAANQGDRGSANEYNARVQHEEVIDVGSICWGKLGSEVRTVDAMQGGTGNMNSICDAIQSRTILMILACLLAFVETILYVRSSDGRKGTVRRQQRGSV